MKLSLLTRLREETWQMRNRFTGAVVAATIAAAAAVFSLTVMPLSGQGAAPAGQGRAQGAGAAAGQGRGQAPAPQGRGTAAAIPRPARIAGHPNLNGIYQSMGTANWNLEDHPAAATQFWQLG